MVIEILDFLYELKKAEHEERLEEKKNNNIVYVTELVGCPAKHYYRVRYPELSFQFNHKLILGDLIHKGLQEHYKILKEKDKAISEVVVEKKIVFNAGEISEDFKDVIIKGKPDVVIKDEIPIGGGNYTVVEIKFTEGDQYIPYKHHLEQLAIYMYLMELQGMSIRKGILTYVTPKKIKEFAVWNKRDDLYYCGDIKIEVDLQKRLECIYTWDLESSVEEKREDWECQYCPFKEVCKYRK